MGVGIADPLPFRRDAEQMLGDDQADQLNIVENGFAARVMIPRKAERGQDPIIEMNVKCGQEGAQICLHTQGLTPSTFDQQPPRGQTSNRTHSSRGSGEVVVCAGAEDDLVPARHGCAALLAGTLLSAGTGAGDVRRCRQRDGSGGFDWAERRGIV